MFLLIALAACGGSSHTKPKQPAEKPDPYWDWHKSQPKSPLEPVRTTKFQPPQQCGQGPYRFVVESTASSFSEGLSVKICTPHGFKGSVSYQAPSYSKSESGFGPSFGDAPAKHHERCRVDATVIATQGTAATGGGKPAKAGAKDKGAAATAAKTTTAIELKGELIETTERCPDGLQEMSVVNTSFSIGDDPTEPRPAVARGPIVIEIWSDLPNDLAGVSFLVHQRGVPAGYKLEDWIAYRKAQDAWYAGHDEALARSKAQGHKWTTYERPAATKQPPPAKLETQTPRPSSNAAWIPGYWQFTDGWVWSAGFWRVPQADVEQEKTVEAPTPPPAPKPDAAPAPEVAYHTARQAVWTPGYWMWNGRSYIWIAGSWRIPEAQGMTWVAPTWRPSRRGTVVYVPGGFVRARMRR